MTSTNLQLSFYATLAMAFHALVVSPASAVPVDLTLQNATATLSQASYNVTAAVDGILNGNNGWANSGGSGSNQFAVFQTPNTFVNGGKLTFSLIFDSPHTQHKLQKIRISSTSDPNPTAAGGNTWTELTPSLAVTSNAGSAAVINLDNTIDVTTGVLPDTLTITFPISTPDFTGFRLEALLGANSLLGFNNAGGNGNYVLSEVQASFDAVPEPSTLTLFGMGLLALVSQRRRRLTHRRGSIASHPAAGVSRSYLTLLLVLALVVTATSAQAAPLTLQNATSLYEQVGFTRDLTIDGNTGTGMAFNGSDYIDVVTWETAADTNGSGTFTFTINQSFGGNHNLKRFRLAATDADRSLFSNNVGTNGDVVPSPGAFTLLRPTSAVSAGGATLTITPDGYITATGTNPNTDVYTITAASPLKNVTGFRMELQPQQEGSYGPGRAPGNGNAVFSEFGVDFVGSGGKIGTGALKQLVLQNATHTFAQAGFPASEAIDGILNDTTANGWGVNGGFNSNQTAVFQTSGTVAADSLLFDLAFNYNSSPDHKLQRFRLSFTTEDNPDTSTTNWTEITPSFLDTSRTDSDAAILSGNIIEITGSGSVTDFYSIGANVPHVVGITGFRLEALLDGGQLGFGGNFVLTEFSAYAASVPEPSTIALLSCGLIGLVVRRRRGRHAASQVPSAPLASLAIGTLAALVFTPSAQAVGVTTAYVVPSATAGNQSFGGVLGLDFTVNAVPLTSVYVSSLGIFDANSNGIAAGTITAELWSRNDNGTPANFADDFGIAKLATLSFDNASPGTLVDGNRFKSLGSSLLLTPGDYTVVAHGFSATDQNGNSGIPGAGAWTTDNGGGLLTFVGLGRNGGVAGSSIGTGIDGGPANRYAAGTFQFYSVALPEPSTFVLLGSGLVGLASRRRRG